MHKTMYVSLRIITLDLFSYPRPVRGIVPLCPEYSAGRCALCTPSGGGRLLAEGKTNKEIAAKLGITVRTVETHRAKIMLKLGLHSLAEIIHYAMRHGHPPAPSAAE